MTSAIFLEYCQNDEPNVATLNCRRELVEGLNMPVPV
jgi:hypothetical protein